MIPKVNLLNVLNTDINSLDFIIKVTTSPRWRYAGLSIVVEGSERFW